MSERKRYYLSFDMDNSRHREAEALFAQQASRQRTEYVVNSILTAHQSEILEQIVRKAVRDELQNVKLQQQTTLPEETDASVQLSDLPGSLIHALEEL
ncbi:plasmid segregation centromere-binding protein ParR [Sinanaerobacter chloroacetimidivorans]|uniref:Plasmid segregation centromere-binding protein ParR n=1 Tax=Sinanaerobacter chloroacetimidivorans TaxID=2818044 RepID=A0A8J7W3W9_9FIRM|nr:plasmid segregation centromere-binding protein ParR [Sinanaerobacter chloroacetimidivorans]MBR0600049.1 plasmid segregation centromere-binding protein ParR [Sinanaerobacter chloroacetimidivorans]